MAADPYVLNVAAEIGRLERQAEIQGRASVLPWTTLAPGQHMLDAGSGSGWVARQAARGAPDAQVTGIDLSADFAAAAQALARDEGLGNVTFRQGDVTALPFDAGSFDLVWSQYVLFFLPDPARAIAEFVRVTRPGGRVTLAVTDRAFSMIHPDPTDLATRLGAFRDTVMHGWESRLLPGLCRAAGLTDLSVEIGTDRVHTFLGRASPAQRRNLEESYAVALQRHPELAGGPQAAARLAADLLAFADDPGTDSVSTYWVVSGIRP